MKFNITMKDSNAISHTALDLDLYEDEVLNHLKKWFEYGEYVTLEVDTEEKTIRVLEADE